jgi:hypothetical protein
MVARMKIVDLKNEMNVRFEQVDARFAQVDARFGAVDVRFERLERALATEHKTTRRHMDVLFEQSRSDFRVALERMDEHERRIGDLLSSNARDHAAFVETLQDHEVRISTLETPTRGSRKPRPR